MEETAVLETTAVETPVESSQPEIPVEESTQSTPDKTEKPLDRRTNPDALRKTLKWLKENGGEHSQQVQNIERMLGEIKSFKTVTPTVREAREMKHAVDSLGGVAKLAEIQQYTTRMQEVDSMLAAGDKRVIPALLENGTQGIVKLLPDMLTELGKSDGQAVTNAIKPHAFTYLQSQQVDKMIDGAVLAFNSNKPEEAREYVARLVDWWKRENGGDKTQADPGEAAWQKEKAERDQKDFTRDVDSAFQPMISHATTAIDKELAPYQKQYGFSGDLLKVIRNDVWKRIERERNNDPLFKSGIAARVNETSRKVDASTPDFLKQQTDQRVKDATRKEIELRYGFIKKQPGPEVKKDVVAAPAGGSAAIDHTVTMQKLGRQGAQDSIMEGKAFNSQGKPIIKQKGIWRLA